MVTPEEIFGGSSEMGALMRARFACAEDNADWSQTPLGAIETWPQSLRTSISICLSSRFPILLWWGTDLVMLYNDAYRPMLGIKHPKSMGQRGRDCWGEVWDVIGPMLEGVLTTGEATWSENQLLLLDRHGYIEECYFTFSYSPIADETGGTGGVFTAVTETTRQVIGERRLQTLRDLAANSAKATTLEEAYQAVIAALANNAGCIPFTLLYRMASSDQAHLVGVTGLESGTIASPEVVDLSQAQVWPFEQVKSTGQPQRIENLRTKFGELFNKNGLTIANDAILLPLTQAGDKQRVIGFLVLGISAKLAFDLDYQSFFELVTGSVETAIANVEAYEAERQRSEALAELAREAAGQQEQVLRKQAETARQQVEMILSSIQDGFYVLDRNWHYTYVSDRLCEMAGKSREELLGHNNWELFPEAVDTEVYVQFQRSLTEQIPVQFEYLYLPWNRWFEYRVYPSPDGLTIFATEVTERKQTEEALRRSEERLRVSQELSLDAFTIIQSVRNEAGAVIDFEWMYVNPKAAEILQHPAHELVGKHLLEVLPGNRLNGELFERYVQVVDTGEPHDIELFYDADGITGWFRNMAVKLEDGVAIFFSDITARKQTELMLIEQKRVLELIATGQSLDECLSAICTSVSILSSHTRACVLLADAQRQTFPRSIAPAFPPSLGQGLKDAPINELAIGTCGTAVYCGESITCPDIANDDHWSQRWRDLCIAHGILACHSAPIFGLDGLPIGSLMLCFSEARMPTAWEYQLANFGAQVASLVFERDRAEVALRQSEEQFRLFVTASSDLVYKMSADWSELYYLDGKDFLASTKTATNTWLETYIPDEDQQQVLAAIQSAIRTKSPFELEHRVMRLDGTVGWTFSRAIPLLDTQGEIVEWFGSASDVTERRQAEAARQESAEQLRLATEGANLGMWYWEAATDTLIWSDRARAIFGIPVDVEMTMQVFLATIHPDDLPYIQRVIRDLELGQAHPEIEYRIRWADGTMRWILARGSCSYTADGTLASTRGVLIDITEQKQTEEALRESLAILNTVNEVTPTLIYIKDRQRRLQMVNPATARLLGKSEAELIGKTEVDYLRPEEAKQIAENDCRVMESGQVLMFEELVVVPEGNRIFLSAKAPYRDEQGNIIGLIGVSTDITDRKRAELALRESEALARSRAEELETLMEVVPVGLWLAHDPDCNQVTVNQAAYNLMRAEPGDPTTATPADGIYPFKFKVQSKGQDISAEELSLQKAGRTGQEVIEEIELVFEDGVVYYIYGRAVPLRNEAGDVRGVIGAYVDISDRKQAETEREQLLAREQSAREAAERANRIKDEFLAVLSHELRSPLNPILGWSKLLQNGNLSEAKTKQALATIERNAKLQAELIEDLLDVSRILRGKLSLSVSPIDLASTIQAAIETVRLAAEAKSIVVEPKLDPAVGLVAGDATRLQQIVWNLLSNAVKFTPSGGQVTVQLGQVNNHAQITVRDTGKGISPDFLPYVFDYFRQADSATTRKFGGLGLGLAIVRHLVELHGGTVGVASLGEGQGATFTVQLPLMSTPSKENQDDRAPQPSLDLSGIKILIVDDEPDTRDLVAFILEQQGAQVTAATSAHEALLILPQAKPDILLSDIGMPDINGYMLIQQVRQLAPEQGGRIPAIALTAYAGDMNQQQALAAGFQKHIAKPIEPEKLIHLISSLIKA